jgi:hypothetical protein
MINA